MRILVLTQYFTPELTAGAARVHAFAAGLAARGHEVEVICEVPNHPRGVVADGYGGRLVDRRSLDGFEVAYVWVSTSAKKTTRSRLAGYGSYAAMATAVGAATRRAEVVYASSPPLPVGAAARAVALRHRVPWVFDVRDLWPAAAIAVGEISPGRVASAAEWLEHRCYASAAAVTTPTESSREHIAAICHEPEKVHLLPSGTTREWLELGEREVERAALGLSADDFIWTYAGNIGLAQDIATAVEAAAELGEGFALQIVGDGPLRAETEALAARLAPERVSFTGLLARPVAGARMRASDALLVSLADAPGIAYAVPSKLYDCCALGRPVIVAAPGEASRLAEDHAIAVAVPPADPHALAAAVRGLRDDPAAAERLASAARAFAGEHLRERGVERLEEILASVV